MNDATKRRKRKFSGRRTSLSAGTSGQAMEQALKKNARGNGEPADNAYQSGPGQVPSTAIRPDGEEMSTGDRRALLNNLSQPH